MDNSENNSTSQKRFFIGIPISTSPSFINDIKAIQLNLSDANIKWTTFSNLHITIKFIGSQPSYYCNSLNLVIEESIQQFSSFELSLTSLGFFGKKERPRVLWCDCSPKNQLEELWRNINKNLERLGIKTDENGYSPHLTLGRIKKSAGRNFLNTIKKYNNTTFQILQIKELALFESISTKHGVRYEILKSHPLK